MRHPIPLVRIGRHGQRGVSLVIALIALVALTLAGLALMRSADTSNVISGNLAFREATVQATDVGVESAITALTTIATTAPDASYPVGCAVGACNYYPTIQNPVNGAGVPTVIDWTAVPTTTLDSSYAVQYVIDRLCDGPTPVTDVANKCMNLAGTSAGSKKAGAVSFTSASQVYYRVLVRVAGPRNAVSIVQVTFAR
jgi:type IV pilus assembly protein PilX